MKIQAAGKIKKILDRQIIIGNKIKQISVDSRTYSKTYLLAKQISYIDRQKLLKDTDLYEILEKDSNFISIREKGSHDEILFEALDTLNAQLSYAWRNITIRKLLWFSTIVSMVLLAFGFFAIFAQINKYDLYQYIWEILPGIDSNFVELGIAAFVLFLAYLCILPFLANLFIFFLLEMAIEKGYVKRLLIIKPLEYIICTLLIMAQPHLTYALFFQLLNLLVSAFLVTFNKKINFILFAKNAILNFLIFYIFLLEIIFMQPGILEVQVKGWSAFIRLLLFVGIFLAVSSIGAASKWVQNFTRSKKYIVSMICLIMIIGGSSVYIWVLIANQAKKADPLKEMFFGDYSSQLYLRDGLLPELLNVIPHYSTMNEKQKELSQSILLSGLNYDISTNSIHPWSIAANKHIVVLTCAKNGNNVIILQLNPYKLLGHRALRYPVPPTTPECKALDSLFSSSTT